MYTCKTNWINNAFENFYVNSKQLNLPWCPAELLYQRICKRPPLRTPLQTHRGRRGRAPRRWRRARRLGLLVMISKVRSKGAYFVRVFAPKCSQECSQSCSSKSLITKYIYVFYICIYIYIYIYTNMYSYKYSYIRIFIPTNISTLTPNRSNATRLVRVQTRLCATKICVHNQDWTQPRWCVTKIARHLACSSSRLRGPRTVTEHR